MARRASAAAGGHEVHGLARRVVIEPDVGPVDRARLTGHAHACSLGSMRTTIEIKPEYRARLLELAARRGHKGFSQLIEEALDAYLRAQAANAESRKRTLRLQGALSAKDAKTLRSATTEIRGSWR